MAEEADAADKPLRAGRFEPGNARVSLRQHEDLFLRRRKWGPRTDRHVEGGVGQLVVFTLKRSMTDRYKRTLAALFIIAASVFAVVAQTVSGPMSETERSVRTFYDGYADDLRQARREGIVDRYDRRGAYLMGNGSKRLQTFEQIKDVYMTKWSGPKSFEWKDLSV